MDAIWDGLGRGTRRARPGATFPLVLALTLAVTVVAPQGCQLLAPRGRAADLHWLATELPSLHKDLFLAVPEPEYREALDALRRRAGQLDEEQYYALLWELLGRTYTYITRDQETVLSTWFPVMVRPFREGWHIIAATAEHADLVGHKVISIDGLPVAEVAERETRALMNPRLCYGLGMASQKDRAVFVLEGPDRTEHEVLLREQAGDGGVAVQPWPDRDSAISQWGVSGAVHWAEDERLLYVRFSQYVHDAEGANARIGEALDAAGKVERVVVDMRYSYGCDQSIETLIATLAAGTESGKISRGGLFGVVGARMYGAAVHNAHELRRRVGAVLFEEPALSPWEPRRFDEGYMAKFLPHSRWIVKYPTGYADTVGDHPPPLEADFVVEQSVGDYFAGRWSVIEAILAYRVGVSLPRFRGHPELAKV